MDPRIAHLKSTTFCGQRLTRKQIARILDSERYAGTCYRAAGWQCVGRGPSPARSRWCA